MKLSNLKKLRVLSGMTQKELSEKLGVSQSYLSLLERNQREINSEINKKVEEIFKDID